MRLLATSLIITMMLCLPATAAEKRYLTPAEMDLLLQVDAWVGYDGTGYFLVKPRTVVVQGSQQATTATTTIEPLKPAIAAAAPVETPKPKKTIRTRVRWAMPFIELGALVISAAANVKTAVGH